LEVIFANVTIRRVVSYQKKCYSAIEVCRSAFE